MASKFLGQSGLSYLWSKIRALIPTRTSQLANDSGYLTAATVYPDVYQDANGYIVIEPGVHEVDISPDVKTALMAVLRNAAYKGTDADTLLDTLEAALNPEEEETS